MAYSTDNPPFVLTEGVGGFMRLWGYKSTDATGVVDGSGYITNGDALGMQAGDVVFVIDTDATPPSMTLHVVASVTAGGAADLTDTGFSAPSDSD